MAIKFSDFLEKGDNSTPHYMVIGHPIGHSLSPVMHQCALDFHQIQAKYIAIDLDPHELTSFVSYCNHDAFLGANITIPYKEVFKGIVDETDTVSDRLGVINTICKENGTLKGYNTDLFGFLKPLDDFRDFIESSSAVIFGSGGASKAVIAGLEEYGFDDITIVSRSPSNKKNSISETGINIRYVDYSGWQPYADAASVIVNSTPLGMVPNFEGNPVDDSDGPLLENKICYDLVYNPLKTRFLSLAEKHDGIIVNGLEMLIWQGSRSFELWTGKSFPYREVKKALSDYFNP